MPDVHNKGASAQSDQRLCCSLSGLYNNYGSYIQKSKALTSFCR